jgi:hypothetical protein
MRGHLESEGLSLAFGTYVRGIGARRSFGGNRASLVESRHIGDYIQIGVPTAGALVENLKL